MAPRLKAPTAKSEGSQLDQFPPIPWATTPAAPAKPAAPVVEETGQGAKTAQAAVQTGMLAADEIDTEITFQDLKNSIKAIPGELGGMTAATPKSLANFAGSLIGLGLGQPAEWAKRGGFGWAQNIPIAGFAFSKAAAEGAKSIKATYDDLDAIIGGRDEFVYDKKTKTWGYNPKPKTDRITQALREGRSPAGVIIEDFGNISLIGSVFRRGFGGAAAVSEVKGQQAAGRAKTATTAEEAAAFADEAARYTAKAKTARDQQQAAAKFERATGLIGAAPILAYTMPIKGATRAAGYAGRSWADYKRRKATRFDESGDATGIAGRLRQQADVLNRFAGTRLLDPEGNPVLDPETGKPLIATRGAVTQWAKDRLRRVEAKKQAIVRQGLNTLVKPFAYDEVNPTTGKKYGALTSIEEEAIFAVRNGRSKLLVNLQKALPDLDLETIVRYGSRSRDKGFSLSDEGARLAVAFEQNLLDQTQARRIAEGVGALDEYIEQNLAGPRREGYGTVYRDPQTGELKRDPLDVYLDMPVPNMERLQQALRRNAATQDLADIFDRIIEQDLINRPADDPVRVNMIAAIAEATPTEVLAPYNADGTLDLSMWPAKERNRIAEIMAIREALGQMGTSEVIGTPPPSDGPGGGAQPLREDPTTGLPTVEDIVAQKLPGQLPRSSVRYMMNSIKALNKLRGRSRALAQQIYDARVAQDALERHIVKMHLELMELEGFWLNRLGRRVEPNKKGELPKSARRIEGLIAEARAIRDQQLALYNDMVAKQQETIVVDGVEVSRDIVASNVETLSRAIEDSENKMDAMDETVGVLAELSDELSDHDAKAAAQLELEGGDPQALRAIIEQDLADMPADLADLPSVGKSFPDVDDILSAVASRIEAVANRTAPLYAQIDAIENQAEAAHNALGDQPDYRAPEYEAYDQQVDRIYEQRDAQVAAIEDQIAQLDDVMESFVSEAADKIYDYLAKLDPTRAAELSKRLSSMVDVLVGRERAVAEMLRTEEFNATRARLRTSIELQEFYADELIPLLSSLAAASQPAGPVSWPGQPFDAGARAVEPAPPAVEEPAITPEEQAAQDAYNAAQAEVNRAADEVTNTEAAVARLKKMQGKPAEPTVVYGIDEVNAALDDAFKRGQVTSNKIKQFNNAVDYSYVPPAKSSDTLKALDSAIFAQLKNGDGFGRAFVQEIDGKLYFSDSYVAVELPETSFLARKIRESGEDPKGKWATDAKNKGDAEKLGVKKVGEGPNFSRLLAEAKKTKFSEPAVIVDSYVGSDGGGLVVLEANGQQAIVAADVLAKVLGPDRTIHLDVENPLRPLAVRQGPGTKDNIVAILMPTKGNTPPASMTERLMKAAEGTLGKNSSVKNDILSNLRRASEEPVAGPTKDDLVAAEKDLKTAKGRLKAAETKAAGLKPVERKAALKPIEPSPAPTTPTGPRTITVTRDTPTRVTYRGVIYELRIVEGRWSNTMYAYPANIAIARILPDFDQIVATYNDTSGYGDGENVFASPVPKVTVQTKQPMGQREFVLDEAMIAVIEKAVKADADALAKNTKMVSKDVAPKIQRSQELLQAAADAYQNRKAVDELVNSVGKTDKIGITLKKPIQIAIKRAEKLIAAGKRRSKDATLRNDIFPLERNIAALDAAIEHFDRTGNWMGKTYGVTGIDQLSVNYLVNVGQGQAAKTLETPLVAGPKGKIDVDYAVESLREAAVSIREDLVAQLEERLSNLTPEQLGEVAKDVGEQTKAAASTDPPRKNALNAKNWVKMPDGSLQFDTGTRTYSVKTVDRPGQEGKRKLKNYVLTRIASDGLPIESTTQVFKTFAGARKYVAETVSIDGNMVAAYSGPKPTLELEPPKTPPFPKDLIDAEARLAKAEGRRVSLLKGLNRAEAKLIKMRVRDAKLRALQPRVAAAEARLESRLGREILTQPELTDVGGQPIPVDPELGVRLRPTETRRRTTTEETRGREDIDGPLSEDVKAMYEAVEASLNEANFRRRAGIPVTLAMRSSMEIPRRRVPSSGPMEGRYAGVPEVFGAGYVPATGRSTGEPGPRREITEGLTGYRKLSSQRYRTGNYDEIYNMRTLIERVVAEQRQMSQHEAMVALMSSEFAVSAEELLGEELIAQFDREAYDYALKPVSEGGIDTYQPGRMDREAYFQKEYAQRRGQLIREEMSRRGWETNPGEYKNLEAARPDRHINGATRFLPKYVRAAVARKTTLVDPSALNAYLRTAQRGTTLFKNLTLPLSITWQLGDIISTFLLSSLTGVPIKQLIENMQTAYEQNYGGGIKEVFKGEADRTIGPIGEFISESGLQDVGLRLEERAALQGLDPTRIGALPSRVPVLGAIPRGYGWFRERAYRFNEFTNRLGRQAYFMSRLQQSLEGYNAAQKQLDPDHIDVTMDRIVDYKLHETNPEIGRLFWDTINQANDVMGDWMDLAPWERRYIMPHVTFYAWIKHINKLFVKLAMNDPTKIMWYMYLGQMAYEPDTDPFGILAGYVPSFAKGYLSRIDFAGPFSDVVNGVPWNVFSQAVGGPPKQNVLQGVTSLFSPVPRLIGAAAGVSFKGGLQPLDRPPGAGAVDQAGRQVAPSLIAPGRLGELTGVVVDTFPLLRKLADLAPDGKIPGTDIQLGPYKTYETGYARTIPGTNIKAPKPMGRVGALLNLFNVPLRPGKTEQQVIEEQIQAIKDLEAFRRQKLKLEALSD
jgi:hypothetical protein